jgi:hypothetical protein
MGYTLPNGVSIATRGDAAVSGRADSKKLLNSDPSYYGTIVADWLAADQYPTQAATDNATKLKAAAMGAGTYAVKFHMDYARVLEDALKEKVYDLASTVFFYAGQFDTTADAAGSPSTLWTADGVYNGLYNAYVITPWLETITKGKQVGAYYRVVDVAGTATAAPGTTIFLRTEAGGAGILVDVGDAFVIGPYDPATQAPPLEKIDNIDPTVTSDSTITVTRTADNSYEIKVSEAFVSQQSMAISSAVHDETNRAQSAETSITTAFNSADTSLDTALRGVISTADESVTTAFQSADSSLTTAFQSADSSVTTAFQSADSSVTTAFQNADASVTTAFQDADTSVTTAFQSADSSLKTFLQDADTSITTAFTNADTSVTTAFTNADTSVTTAFTNADTSVTTAFTNADTSVTTAFTNADASVTTAFQSADSSLETNLNAEISRTTLLESKLNATMVSAAERLKILEAFVYATEQFVEMTTDGATVLDFSGTLGAIGWPSPATVGFYSDATTNYMASGGGGLTPAPGGI